jgi:hypothetical protein
VAQELKTEALALAGAFDEPWHIGNHVASLFGLNNAEVWVKGCERVVGNLWSRRRHRSDQTRLSCARIPDECNVGHRLELENDIALPARNAKKSKARGLALRTRERRVSLAAHAAFGNDKLHAWLKQIGDELALGVLYNRANWNRKFDVWSGSTISKVTGAIATIATAAVRVKVIFQKSGDVRISDEGNASAVSTVCSVGTSKWLKFFAVNRNATVAAVAGAQVKGNLIYK